MKGGAPARLLVAIVGPLLVCALAFPSTAAVAVDGRGRTVELAAAPRRIVTLAPSLAEILAGLGLTNWIVGVEDFTNWPPELATRPRIGSYVDPNLESILALQPDLVIGSADGNPQAVLERLDQLEIPTYVTNPMTLDGVRADIRGLGNLLGVLDQAGRLVAEMDAGIDRVRRAVSGRPRPRVLLLFESEPISTAGKGTFTDELIRLAGGESITGREERAHLQLTIEAVLAARPEVIVLSSTDQRRDSQRLKQSWQRWKTLPAVKSGRVQVVDGDLISRPSQRIVLGLEALARLFHPEVLP